MQPTTPARYLKLERLLDVSRLLNQAIELEPFLQTIANFACERTISEGGSVFLFEEETGLLKFVASPRSQSDMLKRVRIPLEKSVAGRAYTQDRPVIVQDARNEPLVYKDVDHILNYETRSILAVPIHYGNNVLGVLEAVNKFGDAQFTDEDITLLETLAVYAGIALFNTALMEEAVIATQDYDELEHKKNDFIAITSHELRTPLGLIMGHASFLQEITQDEQTSKQLEVIVRSANRLRDIIESLSNIDMQQTGKARIRRSTVSISAMTSEVAKSFRSAAKTKRILLNVDVPDDPLTVQADGEKLAIALGNLVENALAFTDEGGRVRLLAEKLPGFIKVSVIDNGIGIPAKDLHHVFDRFFQVESHYTRRHGGMGLGLSVAKVMVEMHGGQIWAESVEGKGSNFSFLLPTAQSKPVKTPAFE
jgi:signal transduction histidine kinase